MDRQNLTVLTHALVTRITFEPAKDNIRATGIELVYQGQTHRVRAACEVVLSLGAIHTPKVLMQSGIGDHRELQQFGIPIVQHLPGVGQNFQDHAALGCLWEYREPLAPHNSGSEAVCFWKSDPELDGPDLQIAHAEVPISTVEAAARFKPPASSWTMWCGVVRPKSQGRVRLSGPDPLDAILIETNMLSHPDDMQAAKTCIDLAREIGNSAPLAPFAKREVMPGNLKGTELEGFLREAVISYWHQTCTAKMGRDSMSVVDNELRVHGVRNLRIADGSIMPRITTGNTMAPCIVIGERAGEILKAQHTL
jgi:choline dehydrogenase